ncbi:transposase domain protein [Burkholderia mallei]|nr:transposase domain protein [Burkholderia mallei]
MSTASFVKSSTTVRHFTRRPLESASITKSIDHTSLGAPGNASCSRSIMTPWRLRRRRTAQPCLTVQAIDALVIGVRAFAFHQGVQSAVAESTTFVRQLHQTRREHLTLVVRLRVVMQHAARKPDKPAGAALGDVDLLPNRQHCFAFGLRAQGFPLTTTFNASISSIASVSSFFSRAFSTSRPLSRRASETSMPPNFARQV